MAAPKPDLNILHLNNDCLLSIFNYLSLMDLCTIAEVCSLFKSIAEAVFKRKHKHFKILRFGEEFDYQRILKHFGHEITSISFSQRDFFVDRFSEEQVSLIFEWLGKYCTGKLEKFTMGGYALPPTAKTILSKMKHIDLFHRISSEDLKTVLDSCKNLVTLRLHRYDGPFHFANYIMPHLKEFRTAVRLNQTDFDQIDLFFKNHTQLDDLLIEFRNNQHWHFGIDLSFLSHLSDLTKLRLILNGSNTTGTASLSHLNHLLEFSVDRSFHKETDLEILERVGSVESLETLELRMLDVSHVLRGIERFKNLKKLRYFGDIIEDILIFAQLRSNCTDLEVCCNTLADPESLVDVVHNLKKLKTITLRCEVALSETVCADLAKVCSSHDRKIFIILGETLLAMRTVSVDFYKKFNENNGRFVEIRFYT